MKKITKIILIVVGAILLIGIGIYVKLFYIGNKDYSSIVINQVVTGTDKITIKGEITDSSRAFKDSSYTLVGTELYVSVNSVLVSKKYNSGSFEIELPMNGLYVNNIHLTDDKTTKVIYSK